MKVGIEGNYYGVYTKKENKDGKKVEVFKKIGLRVLVIGKRISLDTGAIQLHIEILHHGGITSRHWLDRDDVYAPSAKVLWALGADVSKENMKVFDEILLHQERGVELVFTHKNIGWSNPEKEADITAHTGILKQQFFKAYEGIGAKSEYEGDIAIKPAGSLEKWLKGIKKYVMPYPALQLALSLGFAAVLAGYLQPVLLESILVHFYGLSSSGKTTALWLILSCACKPIRSGSTATQWNSTTNGIFGMLDGNYGFPFGIDELSTNDKRDLSDFVYCAANGSEKDRMTSVCKVRKKGTWGTVIVSTGESSLLSHCNLNAGLNVRTIELDLPEITPSAEVAEKLMECISKNYGWANPKIAEYILEKGYNEVLSEYNNTLKIVKERFPIKDEFSDRMTKKIALIMLASDYGEYALDLKMDSEAILQILCDAAIRQNQRTPRGITENLLQTLLEHLSKNHDCYTFCAEGNKHKRPARKQCVGVVKFFKQPIEIDDEPCVAEIAYYPVEFQKLMAESGLTDTDIALKALRDKGYLSADKDGKLTRKRTIYGSTMRMHILTLPNSLYEKAINFSADPPDSSLPSFDISKEIDPDDPDLEID
ncbi:MAG: DUF927 domain-containing protein [Oscillospiraceae bacterium]|nr:DUF927 domain-containing protein [Oscillospiraceae bacterium]